MWVPQWPLTKEKKEAAHTLIQEQVAAGHLQNSTSPRNTPIFVIKKKSGKWRLLHDLRVVNKQMMLIGSIQLGLPLPMALPKDWKTIVVDIKDCFFSIPLHPEDCKKFAFTVPAINHDRPDERYEWRVLPQGMANSPTMCQLYVNGALSVIRKRFPEVIIYHYMDDILLCHEKNKEVEQALCFLQAHFKEWGLEIAPEKIQKTCSKDYLGMKLEDSIARPLKITIRTDHLKTLNDFQKLLGDINWVRPYLKLTDEDLNPLYETLKGD